MTATTIAFDCVLVRPGCALVQVGLGATIPNHDLVRFNPGTWLTAPTENMAIYDVTPEQLEILVERVNAA